MRPYQCRLRAGNIGCTNADSQTSILAHTSAHMSSACTALRMAWHACHAAVLNKPHQAWPGYSTKQELNASFLRLSDCILLAILLETPHVPIRHNAVSLQLCFTVLALQKCVASTNYVYSAHCLCTSLRLHCAHDRDDERAARQEADGTHREVQARNEDGHVAEVHQDLFRGWDARCVTLVLALLSLDIL